MSVQMTFQRYELKYLLNPSQKLAVLQAMEPHMALDQYGRTTIRNIYFDTRTYRLIRRSIERPAYKEKLRLRSYRTAGDLDPVFVELKKKYKSVVYKRRLILPQEQAMTCLTQGEPIPLHSQIANEINYFCAYYQDLKPTIFLSYKREAFYALDRGELRITFDEKILSRREDFSFSGGIYGAPLLEKGQCLMEVKTPGGIPLWLARCLSEQRIYKTSFSKYGTAYEKTIQPDLPGGVLHA